MSPFSKLRSILLLRQQQFWFVLLVSVSTGIRAWTTTTTRTTTTRTTTGLSWIQIVPKPVKRTRSLQDPCGNPRFQNRFSRLQLCTRKPSSSSSLLLCSLPRRDGDTIDDNDNDNDDNDDNEKEEPQAFQYEAEVVGASTRIGSFWLRKGLGRSYLNNNNNNNTNKNEGQQQQEEEQQHQQSEPSKATTTAAAVPSGISPGYLSPPGSPIYVATRSLDSWRNVWERLPPMRKQDCVFFVQENTIPPPTMEDATFCVVHFDVVSTTSTNTSTSTTNSTNTHDGGYNRPHIEETLAPHRPDSKTVLYGRHVSSVERILHNEGIRTETVETFGDVRVRAGQKVLRESALVGGGDGLVSFFGGGRTSDEQEEILRDTTGTGEKGNQDLGGGGGGEADRTRMVRELVLAMEEVIHESPQSFDNKKEIQQVLEDTKKLLAKREHNNKNDDVLPKGIPSKRLDLEHIHLVAWGKERATTTGKPPKNISIVGGGILGSATALFLAQKLPETNIVVLDQEPAAAASAVGTTTPASWAWINANSKSPKSYQVLNQLGIHAWKHEAHLSSLPRWMGSLVRFEEVPEFLSPGNPLCDGGYPAEGPLSNSQIQELEPLANWRLSNNNSSSSSINNSEKGTSQTGFTYHFPDEACVDPSEAVLALQQASKKLGVTFRNGHNVTGVLRDETTGKVTGILSSADGEESLTPSDLVVSAAGIGAAASCLGGIPLLHRPGQIAYAKPKASSNGKLTKILVDSMRSSHLLQRRDGTLVAGGGALEVGGSSGTVKTSRFESRDKSTSDAVSNILLDGAMQLSPSLVGSAEFSHTASAVRPMPNDGLPVVGYADQGLYVIVTHSGITLGPILASLAAGEIAENIECDLLSPYRPSRFVTTTD